MDATGITPEERLRLIREAAYYLAEQRGFASGDPQADWVAAEAKIDAELLARKKNRGSQK
jgi:hypothetical protein